MEKTEVEVNKPIYLGMSVLDIRKTLMYEFWFDYVKPKYGDRAKFCYTDADSFVSHTKTQDFYKGIANDVKRWFDPFNYDENDERPLPIGKNEKVIGLFKDELDGKIMTEFCALRAKAYAYLMDDDSEKKNAKGTKKCVIKRQLMFKNYKDCLFNDKIILKPHQIFRSDHHNVYTVEIIKIALSNNDGYRVTTYPYEANAIEVCESEMIIVRDFFVKNYADCLFYYKVILSDVK